MYCDFFVFFKNFDSTSIVIRCSDFYFCFLTLDHGKKLNDTLNIQTVAIQSSNIYIYRVRTVMKNLEKSWNFKTAFSRPGKVLEKWINPESFGKVMEIYFTNLCIIQLCLFGSWISVRDCAWAICIFLLFPAAFEFKMMDIHTFIQ